MVLSTHIRHTKISSSLQKSRERKHLQREEEESQRGNFKDIFSYMCTLLHHMHMLIPLEGLLFSLLEKKEWANLDSSFMPQQAVTIH